MCCFWGEVLVTHRTCRLGAVAHPTEVVGIERPESEELNQPFPIAAHLQQSCTGDGGAPSESDLLVIRGPLLTVVPSDGSSALKQAAKAPRDDCKDGLHCAEACTPALAKSPLRDDEQGDSTVSSAIVHCRKHIGRSYEH